HTLAAVNVRPDSVLDGREVLGSDHGRAGDSTSGSRTGTSRRGTLHVVSGSRRAEATIRGGPVRLESARRARRPRRGILRRLHHGERRAPPDLLAFGLTYSPRCSNFSADQRRGLSSPALCGRRRSREDESPVAEQRGVARMILATPLGASPARPTNTRPEQ